MGFNLSSMCEGIIIRSLNATSGSTVSANSFSCCPDWSKESFDSEERKRSSLLPDSTASHSSMVASLLVISVYNLNKVERLMSNGDHGLKKTNMVLTVRFPFVPHEAFAKSETLRSIAPQSWWRRPCQESHQRKTAHESATCFHAHRFATRLQLAPTLLRTWMP